VFILNCPGGPSALRANYGFTGQTLRAIEAALNAVVERLCDNWERLHGID
jgi:hypothetical protein